MKKLILIALSSIPVWAWGQTPFHIKGSFKDSGTTGIVYLMYQKEGRNNIDSVSVTAGKFEFSGQVTELQPALLTFKAKNTSAPAQKENSDERRIFLNDENLTIVIKDSIKTAGLKGSPINLDMVRYEQFMAKPDAAMNALDFSYQKASAAERKDPVFKTALEEKRALVNTEKENLQRKYIKQNPDSYFSLVSLYEIAGRDIDPLQVAPLFDLLSVAQKNSKYGKLLSQNIAAARTIMIGAIAPDFTQNNSNNQPVKLSSFRGKYVLIDFWASWCRPCRAENPNLVKAYAQFKDKNFSILGVSVDAEKDGLTWTQVIAPNSEKDNAGKLYSIKSIPSNFLIDPQGKIIAKNLRGKALEKVLEDLIGKISSSK
ncbi:Peroxiredoxin [Pedobacter steynii]|uniref:Peroxiredoxin n=1 Tax=Pedobacter steynii TaxID=430522 RepID=A0A1G9MPV0_9SPHI|nr:TlpA disulfide reductase family protein [Pedobacter steynii]NQX39531.1 AhpC/TSA family protein [Pedobacter steynii]SDL76322.1 Peroxiredoxin [Pedobacter steynii]